MRRTLALAALLLLTLPAAGCRGARTDPAAVVRASPLQAVLHSRSGQAATVYLFAPDARVRVADAPSCEANTGDVLVSGHYAFYLDTDPSAPVQAQALPEVFPGGIAEFNAQRPGQLEVVPGKVGQAPGLLLVRQYTSCNGQDVAVLALAPDGRSLVPLRFAAAGGRRSTLFASQVTVLGPGRLRTQSYNNARGEYIITTWELHEAEGVLVPVSSEVQERG